MVSDLNLLGTGENLDESLNTIRSEFRLLTQETAIIRPTATPLTLNPGEGTSKNIVNYGRVVADDVADGVDITQAQELADANTAYTPGEVAVQVVLPGSTLRRSADRQLMSNTATMLNNAWQVKEDGDGATQFSSFTITLGAAGTVSSPGHMEAGASLLRIGNSRATPEPAPKPWHAILHPLTATPLRERLIPLGREPVGTGVTSTSAPGANTGAHGGVSIVGNPTPWQQNLLVKGPGSIMELAGFNVQEDANISVDGSDDAVSGLYSTAGLVYVTEVEARMDPDSSDKSMRGAIEMNLWGSYAWGVYRPGAYGIAATFDASLPTS